MDENQRSERDKNVEDQTPNLVVSFPFLSEISSVHNKNDWETHLNNRDH